MLNAVEQLQLKLAVRDEVVKRGLRVAPNAIAALDSHLISKGYAVTFQENGDVTFLGETLGDALERIKSSPEGSIYFDGPDGAAAPVVNSPSPTRGGGDEAVIAEAKKRFNYSDAEWNALTGMKKWEIVEEIRGQSHVAGNESWRQSVAKVALVPGEFESLTPEQKIAKANDATFAAMERAKAGAQ